MIELDPGAAASMSFLIYSEVGKKSAIKFAAHPSSGVNHFQERLMEI